MLDNDINTSSQTKKDKVHRASGQVLSNHSIHAARGFRRLSRMLERADEGIVLAMWERFQDPKLQRRLDAARKHSDKALKIEAGNFNNLLRRKERNRQVLAAHN